MTTDDVIVALDQFTPSEVDRENMERLYRVFDGFDEQPDRGRAIPAMFALMERYPATELGTPGPLVHELEALAGYEDHLRESVLRQPSILTVWMINRILNAEDDPASRTSWLHILKIAAAHPAAPATVRADALKFIAHQHKRGQ